VVAVVGGVIVRWGVYGVEAGAKGRLVLESGDVTHGHRFLPTGHGGEPIHVSSYDELRRRLHEHFVMVEPSARDARIRAELGEGTAGGAFEDRSLPAGGGGLGEEPPVLVCRVPEEVRSPPDPRLAGRLGHPAQE